jgi:hypothetical protein
MVLVACNTYNMCQGCAELFDQLCVEQYVNSIFAVIDSVRRDPHAGPHPGPSLEDVTQCHGEALRQELTELRRKAALYDKYGHARAITGTTTEAGE